MTTQAADATSITDHATFVATVARARQAAQAYYDTGALVMLDADYDALVDAVAAARAAHPDWDDHGVTTDVAAGASAGGDVVHPTAMLSLDKAKTVDELAAFMTRLNGAPVLVEVKLDGVAMRVEYQDGHLTLAATRGDGTTGENLTSQILRGVHGLPAELPTPWTGEVRGEVYMTDADFDLANTNRIAAGGKAFVNSRNAVAGSLRNVDRTYETPMTFATYDISGDQVDTETSHRRRMTRAVALGFGTALSFSTPETLTTLTEVQDVIEAIGERRATLGFPIDGSLESRLLR